MNLVIEMPWEKNLSVNHMRFGKGGGYRKKPEVQAWMEELAAMSHLRAYRYPGYQIGAGREPLHLPVYVTIGFRFPDKRRRDDHNFYKVICDAVANGLRIDDQHIRISTGTVEVDRENPGFTITVEDEG